MSLTHFLVDDFCLDNQSACRPNFPFLSQWIVLSLLSYHSTQYTWVGWIVGRIKSLDDQLCYKIAQDRARWCQHQKIKIMHKKVALKKKTSMQLIQRWALQMFVSAVHSHLPAASCQIEAFWYPESKEKQLSHNRCSHQTLVHHWPDFCRAAPNTAAIFYWETSLLLIFRAFLFGPWYGDDKKWCRCETLSV